MSTTSHADNSTGRSTRYVLEIDADDAIVSVNGDWLDFASENDAPELADQSIVGRRLWEFIEGTTMIHLYQQIAERIRDGGEGGTVRFRCDAPELQRDIAMRIESAGLPNVRFISWLETAESRPPIALLDRQAPRSSEWLRMCSWCKRVLLQDGHWEQIEFAIHKLDLFGQEMMPSVTHGICPTCEAKFRRVADFRFR